MSESMARTSGHQIFVDGFIPKPISIKDLMSKINALIAEDGVN